MEETYFILKGDKPSPVDYIEWMEHPDRQRIIIEDEVINTDIKVRTRFFGISSSDQPEMFFTDVLGADIASRSYETYDAAIKGHTEIFKEVLGKNKLQEKTGGVS